jgi:hypothetical protein
MRQATLRNHVRAMNNWKDRVAAQPAAEHDR